MSVLSLALKLQETLNVTLIKRFRDRVAAVVIFSCRIVEISIVLLL